MKPSKVKTPRKFWAALVLAAGALCITLGILPAQQGEIPGLVQKLSGHDAEVYDLAFTPDGKYLITGSFDNTLKMWDVGSGKELRTFGGSGGHTKMVLCVAVSPDGRTMASGGLDNIVKIWDVPSTSPLKKLVIAQEIDAIAVSPNNQRLAAAGKDGLITIYDATKDYKELFKLKGHTGPVKGVTFSANSAILASAGNDGTLRFWNVANGQETNVIGAHAGNVNAVVMHPNNTVAYTVGDDGNLRFWQANAAGPRDFPPHAKDITLMAVAPNGSQVLTADADKLIRVSNFTNGQKLRDLKGSAGNPTAASFNSNAQFVAAGSDDGKLTYWNNTNGQIVGQVLAHDGPVTAVNIRPQNDQVLTTGKDGLLKVWALPLVPSEMLTDPSEIVAAALRADGTKLYIGGKDKNLRTWDIKTKKMERQFSGHAAPVSAVAISPNGAILASGSEDATIRFWNQSNGKEESQLGAHAGNVTSLAFNTANNQMVSASDDGMVKLWQIPVVAPKSLAHPDQVTSAVLTPDGARLITGCNDKQARLWNLTNGAQERAFAGHALPVTTVAVSDNGQFVGGGSADKSFSVWNLSNGQVVKKIKTPAPVTAIDLNADGQQAFVGLSSNVISVVNVKDGKEIKKLAGHGGAVVGLIHVPQGDLLISASADKTVRIWNIKDGNAKTTMNHAGPVNSLALSKDGKHIAAGSGKTIKIWKLADGKEVASVSTKSDVKSISFSPKADLLVAGEADNTVRVYSLEGKLVEFFSHKGAVNAVAYHNDGKRIVSAGIDKTAQIWTSALIWQKYHGGPIRQIVFSPKNDKVLSAGDDKTIKIWNVADGKQVQSIPAHGGAIAGIGISADATKLASVGADKTVKVWNLAKNDNKPLASISVKGTPGSVALTPDGKRLAVGLTEDKNNVIRVFDVTVQKEIQLFDDHKGPITGLMFHTDNKTLASVSADKTARISTVGVLTAFDAHPGGVASAQFSNTGTQAITGGADKTAKLWDIVKGTALKSFGPTADPISYVTYSPDYTQLGAASGKSIHVWTVANGQQTAKLDHPANVTSLSFNSNKTRLAAGSEDKRAYIWELPKGDALQFFLHDGPIQNVWFSTNNTNVVYGGGKTVSVGTLSIQRTVEASKAPLYALARYSNGTYVFTGGADKEVKMYNTGNGNNERTFKGATEPVKAVAMSDNNLMVAIAAGKTVRLHKFADAKEIKAIEAPGVVQSLEFSANSQTLVGACADKTIIGWNTIIANINQPPPDSLLQPVQTFESPSPVGQVVFASDNATLYSSGKDKSVQVWKLASPAPLSSVNFGAFVDVVAFSPDGKIIAAAGHNGRIRLYDAEKRNQLREIVAHKKANETMIYGLAFSPDSKMVATACYDKTLKLFNVANGAEIREFKAYDEKKFPKGHKDSAFAVAISPDGKYLASGSAGLERVIKLWNISNGQVVREFNNTKMKRSPGLKEAQSHPGWIYKMRFTKDSKRLVSAGDAPRNKGYLAVWNVADGKLLSGQEYSLGAFYGLALSPDNQTLAVGAGVRGRPTPGLNTAYIMKLSSLK